MNHQLQKSLSMTRLYASLGILTMLLISACVSTADVDFAEAEQELVIYSHFGPNPFLDNEENILKIFLTHTRDPLKPNTPFEPVENAAITVYRDGMPIKSGFNRTFNEEKNNAYTACYEANVDIISGSRYSIEVDVEGYKVAKAETVVPHDGAAIISFEKNNSYPTDGQNYKLVFSDREDIEHYYQLIVKILKYESTENGDIWVGEEVIDYELIDPSDFTHFNAEGNKEWMAIYPEYAGFLFTATRQEGIKELFINFANLQNEDNENFKYKYKAELHNVSEAYYLYHQSVQAQLTDQNYLTDPLRIYNNIENGFGNFSAYNIAVAEAMARRIGN